MCIGEDSAHQEAVQRTLSDPLGSVVQYGETAPKYPRMSASRSFLKGDLKAATVQLRSPRLSMRVLGPLVYSLAQRTWRVESATSVRAFKGLESL